MLLVQNRVCAAICLSAFCMAVRSVFLQNLYLNVDMHVFICVSIYVSCVWRVDLQGVANNVGSKLQAAVEPAILFLSRNHFR